MAADLSTCLIYGAYGYTGELIARQAAAAGLRPVLAGRDPARLRPLAAELGCAARIFDLEEPTRIERELEGIAGVLHAAGPFARTSRPMVDACLRRGVHYFDITGEVQVFEACAARDAEAREAEVMLLPGVGFDVVPSDCLAVHLKQRLPEATHLVLAFFSVGGRSSRGTATTMLENLHRPNLIRRDGRLEEVSPGRLRRMVDFGRGPRPALAIPWGDLATAWRSTGIPNMEVYMAMPRRVQLGVRAVGKLGWMMRSRRVQGFLKRRIAAGPAGPSADERRRAFSLLWGEARAGPRRVETRLRVSEGYGLTATASLAIVRRALGGEAQPGFQTPGLLFGPDFILELGGERTDVR